MNRFLEKLERKFGRYALPHLTVLIVGLWMVGYVTEAISSQAASYLTMNIHAILHGQIWRVITWIMVPPSSAGGSALDGFFLIVMLLFYISIGNSLERSWGDFHYNVYMIGGMLITLAAGFLTYAGFAIAGFSDLAAVGYYIGFFFSTYYIAMSLILAYAATFPDAVVLLMFVLPLKMKWLGWIYGATVIYDVFTAMRYAVSPQGSPLYFIKVAAIVASFATFLIFFISSRKKVRLTASQKAMRRNFRASVRKAEIKRDSSKKILQGPHPRHRCEVCGRTDISDPDLEFRFCTKCEGAHEYCMDHLYTHEHIRNSENNSETGEKRNS